MKAKKIAFIISLIATIVSLVLSVAFNVLRLRMENIYLDFIVDMLLGIFSGAFLSTAITILEYLSLRKKNLEELFNFLCNQRNEFDKIKYFPEHICTEKFKLALHERHINANYEKLEFKELICDSALKSLQNEYLSKKYNKGLDIDYNKRISIANEQIKTDQDNILKLIDNVIDSYGKVKYGTHEIGNILADSSFLLNNKKIKNNLFQIYQSINNIEEKQVLANCHFNNYTTMPTSPIVAIDSILELQKCFFRVEQNENCVYEIMVYSEIAQAIDKALDYVGYLCYGKKYKPCTMNDREYLVSAFGINK